MITLLYTTADITLQATRIDSAWNVTLFDHFDVISENHTWSDTEMAVVLASMTSPTDMTDEMFVVADPLFNDKAVRCIP